MNDAVRKITPAQPAEPHYREAPNNIEAEQALLGAILVNNDAYYRVSDFLKPVHLYEPLHRKIFEVAGDIIRMGKTANPVTIKTFLPADDKVGDLTVAQYLARLAAEAVSIINAEDYGRAIYDLALRRALIQIGEDVVNIAYDAPLDMRRRRRSKTPSAACSNWRKPAATMAASSRSTMRWRWRSTWRAPPSSVTAIFPAFPPASTRSTPAWAACNVPTLSYLPVVRVWARPRLPPTSPITSPRPTIRKYSLMVRSRRKRRRRRLLLARNVVRTAGNPYHFRADGSVFLENPPR